MRLSTEINDALNEGAWKAGHVSRQPKQNLFMINWMYA